MIGALTAKGLATLMTLDGATDTACFVAFVEHYLVPVLRPGQIVVMDNLSPHKAPAVRRLIEGAGCGLRYLPPYSPDLNPIEQAWSKVKERLRSLEARTLATLDTAIADAMQTVTAQDARGWFRHCGYEDHSV